MEKISQKEVWDAISEPWHEYRKKMPEEVEKFVKYKTGLILDMGCGSGRNIVKGKSFVGIDFSKKMISLAKKDKPDSMFVIGDLRYLPFKDSVFDSVISVASLHCIKGGGGEVLKEMKRVMKNNSEAFIQVWNKDQPRFTKKEDYIPWKHGEKTYMRYYYLFSKDELEELLKSVGFDILNIFGSTSKVFNVFPRNIIAIVKKVKIILHL